MDSKIILNCFNHCKIHHESKDAEPTSEIGELNCDIEAYKVRTGVELMKEPDYEKIEEEEIKNCDTLELHEIIDMVNLNQNDGIKEDSDEEECDTSIITAEEALKSANDLLKFLYQNKETTSIDFSKLFDLKKIVEKSSTKRSR